MLEALQTAGVLQPGEAPFEEFIDCAEVDDEYVDLDICDVAGVLHSLQLRRARPFANLVFFTGQSEIIEADVIAMVREFARLSGQSERLGAICVKSIAGGKIAAAGRGEFPPNNAVAAFELGTRRCMVPFVMYYKNIPGGLMEALAEVLMRISNSIPRSPPRLACAGRSIARSRCAGLMRAHSWCRASATRSPLPSHL